MLKETLVAFYMLIPGPIPVTVVSAYDADTIKVIAYTWPGEAKIISVRLEGADAPEIRGKCPEEKKLAREARDFVKETVKKAELKDVQLGKYAGRVVAKMFVDGRNLADILIEKGMARPYDGGKRESWCKKEE